MRTASVLIAALAAAVHSIDVYKDPTAPIAQRVKDLLGKMTTLEKVRQTFHMYSSVNEVKHEYANTSFGSLSTQKFTTDTMPPAQNLENRNELQTFFLTNSRLHIPISFSNEGLHSGGHGATIFPELVTLGATWNPKLVEQIAQADAFAGRALGADTLFGPVINLFLDSRFGRQQEGFSQNPTLTYELGAAYTVGMQGGAMPGDYLGNLSTAALGKHFAAYGGAAGGLNGGAADVSNRTLQDVFLKPWRGFGHVGGRAAMPSHNTVQQTPAHADGSLINDQFRGTLGFGDGYTASDCNDIGALENYRLAANQSHRAAIALKAGLDQDLMCGGDPDQWSFNALPQALEEGLIQEADIERAAARVLTHKFSAGLFDNPIQSPDLLAGLDSPAHRALARQAAQEGTVLVKNEQQLLPLDIPGGKRALHLGPTAASGAIKQIAVIGPNGGCANESTPFNCLAKGDMAGSYTQISSYVNIVTVHEGLLNASAIKAAGVQVTYTMGSQIDNDDASDIPNAVAAAKAADVAVIVVGDSGASCGEWGDRDDLDLAGSQLQMLEAIASGTTTPIVLVTVNGRPLTFGGPENAVLDRIAAILISFRPGQEGGNGIADLLLGEATPSGRLAQSWPRSVGQIWSGSSPWLQQVKGKWLANNRGKTQDPDGRRYDNYVGSEATPLFHLGDGTSGYVQGGVTYDSKSLKVDVNQTAITAAVASAEGPIGFQTALTVQIDVSNSNSAPVTEVVEVFGVDPVGIPIVRYWKRVWGFARIEVPAKSTATATVTVRVDHIAFHGADMNYNVYEGDYLIRVGGTSVTDLATTTVTLRA